MKTKPTTIVINSRCDMRSIATLHKYWSSKGYGNLNMSQLLRLSVDHFADVLAANQLVKPFEITSDAVRYLDSVKMSIPPTNRISLLKQIQKETLTAEGFSTDYVDKPQKSLYGQANQKPVSSTLIEQARGLMRSVQPETEQEALKRRDKELKETKEQLGSVPSE